MAEAPYVVRLATEYGWFANLLQFVTFLGVPSLSGLVVWLFRTRNAEKATRASLVQTVGTMEAELMEAKHDLSVARMRDPSVWIESHRMLADRTAGINYLQTRSHEVAPALRTTYTELAKYSEELFLQSGGQQHLLDAQRAARIALLLDPSDKELRERSQTLDLFVEMDLIRQGSFDPNALPVDLPELETMDENLARRYVQRLLGLAIKTIHAGRPVAYEVITRRARMLAMHHLPVDDDITLNARQLWAEALSVNSMPDQAMAEIKVVLPKMETAFDSQDRCLAELRLLEAQVALILGDPQAVVRTATAASAFPELDDFTQLYQGKEIRPIQLSEELRRDLAAGIAKVGSTPRQDDIK